MIHSLLPNPFHDFSYGGLVRAVVAVESRSVDQDKTIVFVALWDLREVDNTVIHRRCAGLEAFANCHLSSGIWK